MLVIGAVGYWWGNRNADNDLRDKVTIMQHGLDAAIRESEEAIKRYNNLQKAVGKLGATSGELTRSLDTIEARERTIQAEFDKYPKGF
jgi:hypothetical protein